MNENISTSLSYRDAGVNVDAGNQFVDIIKPLAARTHRPGVLTGLGGFAALFELPLARYRQPVLVSSTDGVGTKLKLALMLGQHETIGIDLVAMCVNDIIVTGAEPLFFLDYYASGALDIEVARQVMTGIAQGCTLAQVALVGGETAELPGLYAQGDYDLAGFCVGIAEKSQLIDGQKVQLGDVLIGIASQGIHANGYSLVRKILAVTQIPLETELDGQPLADQLLTPTRIYVKTIRALIERIPLHALAHITGGGLIDNIPRVLPSGFSAVIDTQSWPRPPIFNWLQQQGGLSTQELYRTFNCGIGMVVCVAKADEQRTLTDLQQLGETAWVIGDIQANSETAIVLK